MSCVRCDAYHSFKLSTSAKNILGYSSDISLCKQCMHQASEYISIKSKSLILRKGKIVLSKVVNNDV